MGAAAAPARKLAAVTHRLSSSLPAWSLLRQPGQEHMLSGIPLQNSEIQFNNVKCLPSLAKAHFDSEYRDFLKNNSSHNNYSEMASCALTLWREFVKS